MSDLISIGKILGFHGIKGEIKLGYTKGKESLVSSLKSVLIKSEKGMINLTVVSTRFHKNFALVKYKELNSINDVEQYKGLHVYTNKTEVKNALEKDEYLISDLEGLDAFDTKGNLLGQICAVGENPATNLINIKDKDGKIHVIPFVKELVPTVNIDDNKIVINNIEGLID